MRRAARIDANHAEIVAALRKVGASVQSLAAVGGGVPDLLVGFAGKNFLLECKDGSKPPSHRKLTPDESDWINAWDGRVAVVLNAQEAINAITE